MDIKRAKIGQQVIYWYYGSGNGPGYHGATKLKGTIEKITKKRLKILCEDGKVRCAEPDNVDAISSESE